MAASKRRRKGGRPERRIIIRSVPNDPPDYRKLGRAFLAVAMMQAEAEAEAEAEHKKQKEHGGEGAKAEDGSEEPTS